MNEAHWSYLLDSDASFLYGSDWTDHHDGTFTATDVLSGFSDLDLYLMGLVGPESVDPFWLLENHIVGLSAAIEIEVRNVHALLSNVPSVYLLAFSGWPESNRPFCP